MSISTVKLFTRDNNFYRTLVNLTKVIVLQNLITFGVNLADNIMLGRYAQSSLNGVAITNQIQFLLQMFAGGIAAGISVIGAQYWGQRKTEPIKRIAAAGMLIGVIGSAVLTFFAVCFPQGVLSLLTNSEAVISEGAKYMRIVACSYIVFTVTQILLGTLRCVESVKIGFWVSLESLVVNILLNYILIFGKFGFREYGVEGAAAATLAARIFELLTVILYVAYKDKRLCFRFGDFVIFDRTLFKDYLSHGLPLVLSNVSWGFAMAIQTGIVGRLGESTISANSISTTLFQVVSVLIYGCASAAGVVIGKTVGEGRTEDAKSYAVTLQFIFLALGIVSSIGLTIAAKPCIRLYSSITEESAQLTLKFIRVLSVTILGTAYQMPCLTGIVSGGGQTKFVLFNDLIFMWGIVLPASFVSAFVLEMSPVFVFACLKSDQVLKCAVAVVKVNRFTWIRKLTR